jgi:hypothetical protein
MGKAAQAASSPAPHPLGTKIRMRLQLPPEKSDKISHFSINSNFNPFPDARPTASTGQCDALDAHLAARHMRRLG